MLPKLLKIKLHRKFPLLQYSGKLSGENTSTFFAVSEPSVKVFSARFCGHTYKIIGPEQSTKVYFAKCLFFTETQKFSAILYISIVQCFCVLDALLAAEERNENTLLSHDLTLKEGILESNLLKVITADPFDFGTIIERRLLININSFWLLSLLRRPPR